MKYLLITQFLYLSFCTFSQQWREEKATMKGIVKSIRYESTLYLGQDEEDWIVDYNTYEYNQNGYLIRQTLLGSMADYESQVTIRHFNAEMTHCLTQLNIYENDTSSFKKYEYLTNGQTSKEILINLGVPWSTSLYIYNKKGLLIEQCAVIKKDNDSIRTLFVYDTLNRKIQETHLSISSHIIKKWDYDQFDNVLEETSELLKAPPTIIITTDRDGTRDKKTLKKNPDDDRNYKIQYKYNPQNQRTHEVKAYLDGRVQYDVIYEYNENGEISMEYYLNLKNVQERWLKRNIYKYDSFNNWISKTAIFDGELEQVETRVIDYFNEGD